MKTITKQQFVDLLMKEVQQLYKMREKAGGQNKYERIAFGNQIGLLYVIDQLKNVYNII